MPNTPRMQWPVPGENLDPWFDSFSDMMDEVDASVYASREDRNIICMGGGIFTAALPLLSWVGEIQLLAANTGFLWLMAPGNVSLADGQMMYVELPRAPQDNVYLTPVVSSNLSAVVDGDAALVICIRRGTTVYFRQGDVLQDGEALAVFEQGAGQPTLIFQQAGTTVGTRPKLNFASGAVLVDNGGQNRVDVTISTIGVVGQTLRRHIPLTLTQNTFEATFQVMGDFSFDPDDYTITGTTRQIRFIAVGFITLPATTGEIQLYNLTDAVAVATLSFTGGGDTTPVKKVSSLLSLPVVEKIYEIRVRVTGGTPPTDKVFAMWAGFQIDNLFTGGGGGGSIAHRYSPPERWAQQNVIASQTDVDLAAQVSTNFDTIRMTRDGSIVGLSTQLTQAITAGTATVSVTINGAAGILSVVHTNASNMTGGVATQGVGVDAYVAGDLIGIQVTTSGGFLPVTTDLESWLEVEELA